MKTRLAALFLLLAAALVLYAQDNKTVKINGFLIDNACAGAHVSDADFGDRVKKHSKSCALMDSCVKSGYAVYSESKLYKLDDNGNKAAADLLHSTDTAKGLQVTVEGTVDGDTLKVKSLTEVKE